MRNLWALYGQRCVIIILAATLLGACTDSMRSAPLSDYELATQYMSDEQYSSAIVLLEGRLRQYPRDDQAKFLLAAAYAGRGGILVTQFFDIGSELDRLLSAKKSSSAPQSIIFYSQLKKRLVNPEQIKLVETLENINLALWELENFIQFFERLPNIKTPEAVTDVEHSVVLLNQITGLEKGRLIYRGLLKLSLYKHTVQNLHWFQALLKADFCNFKNDQNLLEIYQFKNRTQSLMLDLVLGRTPEFQAAEKQQEIEGFIETTFAPLIDFFVLHNSFAKPVNELAQQLGQTCTTP